MTTQFRKVTLDPAHHVIFACMTPHREMTARDILNRAKPHIPNGWTVYDVVHALRKFIALGAVRDVGLVDHIHAYVRIDNFPNGVGS
jgi:hypothetical protein